MSSLDDQVVAPASLGQRMLWALGRHREDQSVLNCPVLCELRGPLSPSAPAAALDRLVARHETLRTTYRGAGARLAQVVHPAAPVPLQRVDLTDAGGSRPDALAAALAAESARPLDPVRSPLRATLWRAGPEHHVLGLTVHHLATDTTSSALMFAELVDLLGGAEPDDGPEPGWSYRRFARWQLDRLAGGAAGTAGSAVAYWQRRLDGVRFPDLPARDGADARPEPADSRVTGPIERDVVASLRGIAREEDTTLFVVLLAAWFLALRGVAGQRDLAVSTIVGNRALPEIRRTVGFFANMIVLRARVPRAGTFADLVRAVRTTVVEALAHQEVPYHLVPRTPGAAAPGRADEVVFQMISEDAYTATAGDLRVSALVPEGVGSRFGLELGLIPRGEALEAVLLSPPGRFPRGFTRALLARYVGISARVSAAPGTVLSALDD